MNLREYLKKRSLSLYIVFFSTSFLLILLLWLNSITSYGNFHLSIKDSITGILGDVFLKDGALYIGFPTFDFTYVFSKGMVKYIFKAFRIPFMFVVGNFFFLLSVFAVLFFISLVRFISKKGKASLKFTHQNLWSSFLLLFFIMSLFPVREFTGWIPYFDYTTPPQPGNSIARFLYEIISFHMGGPTHTKRLLFAYISSFAEYGLEIFVLMSLFLLIYSREKIPKLVEKSYSLFFKIEEKLKKPRYFFFGILSFFFILSLSTVYFVHGGVPGNWNQIALVFQAKIFKSLSFQAPLPAAFELLKVPRLALLNGWFSSGSASGYSFFLLPFEALKIPWLLNVIVGCVTLIFFYRLLSALEFENGVKILSCTLLILSPSFLKMSSQFQNQGLVNLLFILFLIEFLGWKDREENKKYSLRMIKAGFLIGLGLNIRPLSTIALSIPFIFVILRDGIKCKRLKDVAVFFLVISGFVLLLILCTRLQTGFAPIPIFDSFAWMNDKMLAFPQRMGQKGFVHLLRNLKEINFSFFGWPFPAFFLLLLSQILPVRSIGFFRLLMLGLIILLISHAILFNPRIGFHPHIINSSACGIALLASVGIHNLRELVFRSNTPYSLPFFLFLLMSVGVTFFTIIPNIAKNNGESNRLISRLVESSKIKDAVVFIDSEMVDYKQAFYLNDPFLKKTVIFAKAGTGELEKKFMDKFPGRKSYTFSYSDEGKPIFIPLEIIE